MNKIENIGLSEKKCPMCKEIKSPKEYYKSNRNKSGLSDYCRLCNNLKVNNYIYKDLVRQQKANQRSKEYYYKNRSKAILQSKEYREGETRLKWLESSKRSYQKHREARLLSEKLRQKNNAKNLETTYLKRLLITRHGCSKDEITPEMITLKRKQLQLFRELKHLKEVLKNGITGHRD